MIPSWLERTELLLGDEKLSRLRDANVLVVGLGGVGAYAAEMIVRAGVGRMTIADADVVAQSNINRQLVALHSTVGRSKTDILAERLRDINPEIELSVVQKYIRDEATWELLDSASDGFRRQGGFLSPGDGFQDGNDGFPKDSQDRNCGLPSSEGCSRDGLPGAASSIPEHSVPGFDDGRRQQARSGRGFYFVVDAIDTLSPKAALIKGALDRGIPLVSSMGAGAKTDPAKVEIADISKSHHCPLAHMLRKRLHKWDIRTGFWAVFSPEPIREGAMIEVEETNKKSNVGTISYMPAVFGCACASVVIRGLIGEMDHDRTRTARR